MSHRTHNGHLAEQHTEQVFWRPAILALLALAVGCAVAALTGCVVLEQTNGTEHVKMTGLFTNLTAASDCTQGDPGTGIVSQTHHTLTSNGDTATLHEAGGIMGGILAFAAKFIPVPVPPVGVREGAVPSPSGSPAVTSCPGEGTTLTPADPVDHGSQPELMRPPERRP